MTHRRDDADEVLIPRARESAHTLPGLEPSRGTVHALRTQPHRSITPTSPTSALIARTDPAAVLERLDVVEGKIDELIKDWRADRRLLDVVRGEVRMLRLRISRLVDEAATKTAVRHLAGEVDDVKATVMRIDSALGRPPQKLEQRASQSEYTPAELVELEQGTGLAGVVGRLVAGQARLNRRVAIGAILGSAAVPLIAELLRLLGG